MYKKSLILVSVILFVLCIFSGFVSATDEAKNAVSNVTNTVIDGANHLGSDVRNGVGNMENGIEDALDFDKNGTTDMMNDNTKAGTSSDYTATRTTANGTNNNNASTLWVWLTVAIAAIVIIGLVWYYGTQNRPHNDE